MVSRRSFLKGVGAVMLSSILYKSGQAQELTWRMPDEAAPHGRTWMAFGASQKIWGRKLLPEVQNNLVSIALSIAKYEPVSMLVRSEDVALLESKLGNHPYVTIVVAELNDLWLRDTGPVFVVDSAGHLAGVDFNFNGWGEKQDFAQDAKVAALITEKANVEHFVSSLILEGGGIEVDGEGTAIITESCVLNPNRNPGVSKEVGEEELKRLLGLEKIIWLPGISGKDITDGHTDFYARFIRPGVVVAGLESDPEVYDYEVTREHLKLLQEATDARNKKLEVITLAAPTTVRPEFETAEFAPGYIGFYVYNGAVLMPEFGDAKADSKARDTLQRLFPDRVIEQLNIDAIAAGGGSIHCTTQQEPKV
jgi:agmatine deiminase